MVLCASPFIRFNHTSVISWNGPVWHSTVRTYVNCSMQDLYGKCKWEQYRTVLFCVEFAVWDYTAQKEMATGENGTTTVLKLGTHVRSIAKFQPHQPLILVAILHPSPFPSELWSPHSELNKLHQLTSTR